MENYYFPLLSHTNLTPLVLFIKTMSLFFSEGDLRQSIARRLEEKGVRETRKDFEGLRKGRNYSL